MGNLLRSPTESARSLGYTRHEIRGPSANWAKFAEYDDASPPITPNAQVKITRGPPVVEGITLRPNFTSVIKGNFEEGSLSKWSD